MGKARNPFRGIVDTMSEMARMREYAEGGGGQEEGRRTHATAWVPTTDIFALGEGLVTRCEVAGVRRGAVEGWPVFALLGRMRALVVGNTGCDGLYTLDR